MSHYLELATEKLNSLKGQLNYAKDALTHDLELWERKEFSEMVSDYTVQIQEQEQFIASAF